MESLAHQGNLTSDRPMSGGPIAAALSMTLGVISNIVALFILANAYSHQRRRSKATFLLFASSLVLTDFFGHIIPGALVLRLYLSGGVFPEAAAASSNGSTDPMCQFLGGSIYGVLRSVPAVPGLCDGRRALSGCHAATAPLLLSYHHPYQAVSLWYLAGGPLRGPAALFPAGVIHLPAPQQLVFYQGQ